MHYSFQPRIFSRESKITELNFGCKLHSDATIYDTFLSIRMFKTDG